MVLFKRSILAVTLVSFSASAELNVRETSLEELLKLDVAVISSTLGQEKIKTAPSTIYSVSQKEIKHWGIRRLSELIERLIPGATSTQDGDNTSMSFRGVAPDDDDKVMLLLNGHYYSTQWNNGSLSESENALLLDLDHVEVIIGPGSALYGSGALLGVINLITRSETGYEGTEVSLNAGTGSYLRADAIGGGKTAKGMDLFFSAGGYSAYGYTNNDKRPLNTSRYPPGFRFFASAKQNGWEVMTRFQRSTETFHNLNLSSTAPAQWSNYDTFFVDARKTLALSDSFRLVFNLNYDAVETQRHDFLLGTQTRAVGERRYGGKITGFYTGIKENTLVFGAEYRLDDMGADWYGQNYSFLTAVQPDGSVTGAPSDPFTKRVFTPYRRSVAGVFLQDSYVLAQKLTLLLGGRFDYVGAPRTSYTNAFTPRIAVVYAPDSSSVVKAMYSTGFRQIRGVYTAPDPFAFGGQYPVVNNPKPERIRSFEVTGSTRVGGHLNLGVNLFYNSLSDVFGSGSGPGAGSSQGVDMIGFEAMVDLKISDRVTVKAIHQMVRLARILDDPRHSYSTLDSANINIYPENLSRLLAEVALVKNRIWLNSSTNYVWQSYQNSGTVTLPTGGYLRMDANLVVDIMPSLEVILSIYNLTNDSHLIATSSAANFGIKNLVATEPLAFHTNLTYAF